MPRYRDVVKILKNNGWMFKRQGRGSHEVWFKGDQNITVPKHPSKEIATGTYKAITKKAKE